MKQGVTNMQNILIVVDMQNDFIDGALGTNEAAAIVPKVEEKIRNFEGKVFFTRDTHETYYLETQEGKPSGSSLYPGHSWMADPGRAGRLKENRTH